MLHTLASLPNRRYKDSSFNLDLSYVTPHLLAAAMPTTSWAQSWYRTPASELQRFLEERHGSNWRIWSLQEDHELGYNAATTFGTGHVARHPVADHGPVPFAQLLKISAEIREFLESDQRNVALVHCKQGRGRTGTVIIAYLMLYHGLTYDQAMTTYTTKRRLTTAGWILSGGVSILAQQRYLGYVARWVAAGQPSAALAKVAPPRALRIGRVVLRNPRYDDLEVEVADLAPGGASQRQWDIVRKPSAEGSVHILRPLGEITAHTPDLRVHVVSRYVFQAVHLPHSSVTLGFNACIENGALEQFVDTDVFPHVSPVRNDLGGPATSVFSSSAASMSLTSPFAESGYYSFGWDQTDGLAGSRIRGTKAFDSIEVYWVANSPAESILSAASSAPTPEAVQGPEIPSLVTFQSSNMPYPTAPSIKTPNISPKGSRSAAK